MNLENAFEFQPNLVGETLSLRGINPADFDGLYAVASDPLVWAQHPSRDRYQRAVFDAWFTHAINDNALVVEEKVTSRIIGSSRFYQWQPDLQEVAIGYTFLARDHWGGAANAELKRLMLEHAFRWARTVWFHVNAGNTRSQKAMVKIGARHTHTAMHAIGSEPAVEYMFFRIDRPARG